MEAAPWYEKTVGEEMMRLAATLFPIFRSMTGEGVRETLRILKEHVPLTIHEVPTGTKVLDWEVPHEWNCRDAYIRDESGERLVDLRASNLHVVSYSVPVREKLSWSEIEKHLFTLPEQPDRIPYRTAFFERTWGFCSSHDELERIRRRDRESGGEKRYEVCVDSTLEEGSLTYGELLLPGEDLEEVLFSTHICHPSLANVSGLAVATFLARHLGRRKNRYSYRFLFIPATIGSITWLARNRDGVARVRHGMVLRLLGDRGEMTYKRSRRGDAMIDRAAAHVLRHSGTSSAIVDFRPTGGDERQFCSPGFDLPVGCLMRTPEERYPEYHTSADDLDRIGAGQLGDSWARCAEIVEVLEGDAVYLNQKPYGEPRLGTRGLYRAYGKLGNGEEIQHAVLWVLSQSDGKHSLLDIADRSGIRFAVIRKAADLLLKTELLREAEGGEGGGR